MIQPAFTLRWTGADRSRPATQAVNIVAAPNCPGTRNVQSKMAITIDKTANRSRSVRKTPRRKAPIPKASLTETSDEDLLLLYRSAGDRTYFAALVERYERELFNYLRRYLASNEMAEDVFQATFFLVHLKCKQFEQGRKFRPWLYAVATNAAIDAQRRNKRHRAVSLDRVGAGGFDDETAMLIDLLVSDDPDPLIQASHLENGEWIQRALAELSDQMRSVVHLVYYQGMKYREAAEVLEIPVGTVKSRLHAAIHKLNEYWNETHTG
jgi:RNA polymerase sigma-70 factor (ECF subfamily)